MSVEEISQSLTKKFGDSIELVPMSMGVASARTPPDLLREVITYLKENFNFYHISTITGTDLDKEQVIELLYHFRIKGHGPFYNIRVHVPRDKPEIESIVDLIPGATLYEREVHDFLGVVFKNHPSLDRLILPDKWPEGLYPLRKEETVKTIKDKLGD